MPIDPQQVDLWRYSQPESQRLEFKEARNNFSLDKLNEYCVAIANEGGGHLVLGIADKPPRPVVSTTAFPNRVETAEKLFNAIGFRVDVEEVMHPDGRVLVFIIPSRPRGTAYHLNGRYLMRSGASLVSMSEDQLRRIFAEGQPDWLEHPSASSLDDQQVVELLDMQSYFELLKQPAPTNRAGVIDRLISDRLIRREKDGQYSILRIASLLLARRLDDFPDVSRKAPRVIVYNSSSKLDTKLDQSFSRGLAVAFQPLIHFILSQLPQHELIDVGIRKQHVLLPEIAVREVVANALIHQDLSVSGASVLIEVHPNRVEFTSPGEPIVPVDRFIDGYRSRNERLADIMRRMNICEERSSGIDKVVAAVETLHLPPPDFRTSLQRTHVTLFGPKPFDQMDRDERIRACYQHCVLKWVMSERMTNLSLRQRFTLAESKSATASQVIAFTIDAGKIKPDTTVGNSRKLARYLPSWA